MKQHSKLIAGILLASSVALASYVIPNGSVTRPKLAALGQITSLSSGNYSLTGTTGQAAVTNLSVTLTTTGRPVMVILEPDGTTNTGAVSITWAGGSSSPLALAFKRGSTSIGINGLFPSSSATIWAPCSAFSFIDTPTAGTYNYTANVKLGNSGDSVGVSNCILMAYEM